MKAVWTMHILHPLIFFHIRFGSGKERAVFRGFLQEHRIDMVIDQDPQTYYKLYPFSKALRGVYIISVIHYNPLGIYHHLGEFVMWVREKTQSWEKSERWPVS